MSEPLPLIEPCHPLSTFSCKQALNYQSEISNQQDYHFSGLLICARCEGFGSIVAHKQILLFLLHNMYLSLQYPKPWLCSENPADIPKCLFGSSYLRKSLLLTWESACFSAQDWGLNLWFRKITRQVVFKSMKLKHMRKSCAECGWSSAYDCSYVYIYVLIHRSLPMYQSNLNVYI